MVDAIIHPTGHKIWVEKVCSDPEINMTLFDDYGEVRIGLTAVEATAIRDSLTRELKEYIAFQERLRGSFQTAKEK